LTTLADEGDRNKGLKRKMIDPVADSARKWMADLYQALPIESKALMPRMIEVGPRAEAQTVRGHEPIDDSRDRN